MDQDAFRSLLNAPRTSQPGPSRTTLGAPAPKRGWSGKSKDTYDKALKKDDKPKEPIETFAPRNQLKKGGKYKDRAEARRLGLEDEYKPVEQLLEDFERRKAEAGEDAGKVEETRAYLGGDATHSILVKGLDYALLAARKAELNREKEGEAEEELEAFAEDLSKNKKDKAKEVGKEVKKEESLGSRFKSIAQRKAEAEEAANGAKKKKKKKKVKVDQTPIAEDPTTLETAQEAVDVKREAGVTEADPKEPTLPQAIPKPMVEPVEDEEEEDIFGGVGEYKIEIEDEDEDEDEGAITSASKGIISDIKDESDRTHHTRESGCEEEKRRTSPRDRSSGFKRSRSRSRSRSREYRRRREYSEEDRRDERSRYRDDRLYDRRDRDEYRSHRRVDDRRGYYERDDRGSKRQDWRDERDGDRYYRSRDYRSRSRSRSRNRDRSDHRRDYSRSPRRQISRSPSPTIPSKTETSPINVPQKRPRSRTRSPTPSLLTGPPLRSPSRSPTPSDEDDIPTYPGTRLQPLASSAISDLRGFLAAEQASAADEEKKLRKARWRAQQGLGVQEGVDLEKVKAREGEREKERGEKIKLNRDYQMVMNYSKKKEAEGKGGE